MYSERVLLASLNNGQGAGKPLRERTFRHFVYGRVCVGETMNNILELFCGIWGVQNAGNRYKFMSVL
ncbi:hypothetical protein F220043C3_37490 [Enterocloster asparagiformis]